MAETKFLDKAGLTKVLENANAKFSKVGHTHTKAEITDFAHTHDDRYYTESEIDTKVSTLNSAIAGKAASGHNHDDRYYTETEMNTKLAGKSDTSHSHTTHLTTEIAASTDLNAITTPGWYKCSASSTAAGLKNCPTEIAFAMEVLSNAGTTQKVYEYSSTGQKIYTRNLYDGTWGAWARVYTTTNKPTLSELDAASSGHTHDDKYQKKGNYAGSSSDGGAATSANKLNTDAGSLTQPVYFKDGVPVNTQYTLAKSVPSNADFTNTHYASKNVVGSSTATSNTTTALTNGNVYLNSVENGAVTSAHKISGSGTTTVTTDASGNIVISSTTHPTSLKNPNALTISLNGTSQGAYDGSGKKDIDITASKVGAYTTSQVDSKINDANKYTDTKISDLINGAPETLDTLGEIATAMKNNEDVVAALNDAIGTKANSSDLNTHINSNVHITSTERSNWDNAYKHAVTNKGGAFGTSAPTLYKITTNAEGHVTDATAVIKSDITGLGIPGQDTWTAMSGATSTAAGRAGYVPAPAAGKQASFLRGDGTWAVPTNTDTKVTQTAIADVSTYTNWRTVNFGASNSATEDFTPSTVTDGVYASKNLSFQPSSGTLKATKFKGALNGTADVANKLGTTTVGSGIRPIYLNAGVATQSSNTVGSGTKPVYMNGGVITECGSSLGVSITGNAATATKATKDSADQQITTTYIKNISISGQNVTVTKGDGSTFPLTTQDTRYAALTNDEIDACFTEVFG